MLRRCPSSGPQLLSWSFDLLPLSFNLCPFPFNLFPYILTLKPYTIPRFPNAESRMPNAITLSFCRASNAENRKPFTTHPIPSTFYLSVSSIQHQATRIQHPVSSIKHPAASLKPRCRSSFAEKYFTGSIFGHMFFQLFAPQGLKCPATAIQRICPGKVCMLAHQVTEIYFTGRHARVFCHIYPFKITKFLIHTIFETYIETSRII